MNVSYTRSVANKEKLRDEDCGEVEVGLSTCSRASQAMTGILDTLRKPCLVEGVLRSQVFAEMNRVLYFVSDKREMLEEGHCRQLIMSYISMVDNPMKFGWPFYVDYDGYRTNFLMLMKQLMEESLFQVKDKVLLERFNDRLLMGSDDGNSLSVCTLELSVMTYVARKLLSMERGALADLMASRGKVRERVEAQVDGIRVDIGRPIRLVGKLEEYSYYDRCSILEIIVTRITEEVVEIDESVQEVLFDMMIDIINTDGGSGDPIQNAYSQNRQVIYDLIKKDVRGIRWDLFVDKLAQFIKTAGGGSGVFEMAQIYDMLTECRKVEMSPSGQVIVEEQMLLEVLRDAW